MTKTAQERTYDRAAHRDERCPAGRRAIPRRVRVRYMALAQQAGHQNSMVEALDLLERARQPVNAVTVLAIIIRGLARIAQCDTARGTLTDQHDVIRLKPRLRRRGLTWLAEFEQYYIRQVGPSPVVEGPATERVARLPFDPTYPFLVLAALREMLENPRDFVVGAGHPRDLYRHGRRTGPVVCRCYAVLPAELGQAGCSRRIVSKLLTGVGLRFPLS